MRTYFLDSSALFSLVTPLVADRGEIAQAGLHASSQPTHVDQEVQLFLEVHIPLNIGSRSVQMRGRHSAVKIHMNDRMHALLLASGKLSRQRILPCQLK